MRRIKFTYKSYRVTLVREGPGRWRNYLTGPPGVAGLSRSGEAMPLLTAVGGAISAVSHRTRRPPVTQ